jgi:hypothetical protein
MLTQQVASQPADARVWGFGPQGNTLYGFTSNDAYNATSNWLQVTRSVNTVTNVAFPNGLHGIGTSSPLYPLHVTASNSAANQVVARLDNAANSVFGPILDFGCGYSGLAGSTKSLAQIKAAPDTSTGGRLVLSTTNISGVTTDVITISATQNTTIAGPTYIANTLTVTGNTTLNGMTTAAGILQTSRGFDDPMQNKLVLQYDFKEGTLTTTYDQSQAANNGTMPAGTFSWSTSSPYDGLVGAYINVTGAYWTCNFANPIACGSNFTFSVWYYYTGTVVSGSNYNTLLAGGGTAGNILLIQANGNNTAGYYSSTFYGSGHALVPNKWYHLTVVVTGSTWQLYSNGVLVSSLTGYPGTTTLGQLGQTGVNTPLGKIEDARIWLRSLNAREVGLLYSQKTHSSMIVDVNNGGVSVNSIAGTGAPIVPNTNTAAPQALSTAGYFPTAAMTSATGPNGFVVTASSTNNQAGYAAFQVFDRSPTYTSWASAVAYSGTAPNQTYSGSVTTTVSGTSVAGEWLQLQTPIPYRLINYTVTDSQNGGTTGRQKQWTLAGSLDGNTWFFVDSQNLATPPTAATVYTPASPGTYSYYRMIFQTVTAANTCDLGELLYFGVPTSAAVIFPINPMTSTTTNGYTVTASSQYDSGHLTWYAFDRSTSYTSWASGGAYYNGSGTPNAGSPVTTVSGSAVTGDWLQLATPVPYRLVNYTMNDGAGRQKAWTLAGSTDGSTWTFIDSRNFTTPPTVATVYTPASTAGVYSYYRLIVTVVAGSGLTDLTDLWFFGVPTTAAIPYPLTNSLGGNTYVAGGANIAGPLTQATCYFWYYLQNAPTATATANLSLSGNGWSFNASVSSPNVTGNLFTTDVASNDSSTAPCAVLLFPYSGVYSLVWQARFNATSSENCIWFLPYATATYVNNNNNNRLAYNSTASFNVTTTYVGYFTAGDRVCMCGYSAVSNSMINTLGAGLQVTLLQRTA